LPPTAALRAARRRLRRRLAPLRGAILLRAARAKYLYQYRKVASFLIVKSEMFETVFTHHPTRLSFRPESRSVAVP